MTSSLTKQSGPTLTNQGSPLGPIKVGRFGVFICMRSDQSGLGAGTSLYTSQIPVAPEVHFPITMRAVFPQLSWNIKAVLWSEEEPRCLMGQKPHWRASCLRPRHSVLFHSHAMLCHEWAVALLSHLTTMLFCCKLITVELCSLNKVFFLTMPQAEESFCYCMGAIDYWLILLSTMTSSHCSKTSKYINSTSQLPPCRCHCFLYVIGKKCHCTETKTMDIRIILGRFKAC